MKAVTSLLITALYTVFVQNLVVSSGLGLSEAIRVSDKKGMFVRLALMISGFSTATGFICALIDKYSASLEQFYVKAAVYGGVLALLYFISAVFAKAIFRADKETMGILGISALNTLVYAVPYINNSGAYSIAESIGSGIGAGFAFVIAAALIGSGAIILKENDDIPEVFKGTPAMFIYVGIISLGFSGFTGTTIF